METKSISFPVIEQSQVGDLRRQATALAARLGMNEAEAGRVAIVATELANNLLLHAGGGEILVRPLGTTTSSGIETICLDKGPGLRNVARSLEDGFSTAGTPGNGLGAVRRCSRVFDLYTQQNAGLAVLSQVWGGRQEKPPAGLEVGAVCVPKTGEDVSGDAWGVSRQEHRTVFVMADGLGHGPSASLASQEAIRLFRDLAERSPMEILNGAHAALRSTRGAAMAIAAVDEERGEVRFAGVGNIAAAILAPDGTTRNMVSYNGTVGQQIHKLQEFVYEWKPVSLLLMHSDGLGTQWRMESYPGLRQHHPSLIAGVLYRDFQRGRDDVTVLAAKAPHPADDGAAR